MPSPDDLKITHADGRLASTRRTSWRETAVFEHFVQFYRNDAVMVEAVADFLAVGLCSVEGALVIGTPDHRRRIERRLEADGVDLGAARARRQFVALDARETLETFLVNGAPDERRFHQSVGNVVKTMACSGFRVRAFGQMVALLVADGNPAAALRLEELWNGLSATCRFSLFCAYPMDCFKGGAGFSAYAHVCASHSSVIPALAEG